MSTKKNAGRKRGGKKSPANLDEALFGDYQENEILVPDPDRGLSKVRRDYLAKRGKPVPTGPDSDKPKKRLDWRGRDRAIYLVMETRERMKRIPECPDPSQEQDRLEWLVHVGGMIVEAIMQGDKAALPLFEGIAKVLKDGRVDENGDWKPVDAEWTEAAVIVRRQYDERPEWHLPPITDEEFGKRLKAAKPKAGDLRRTVGRMTSRLGAKKIPGKKGRPKK